jgi:hypothetical protein
VQNGTSLQELQQLGAWASHEMVLRYAHLSSNHLKQAAERVAITQNSVGTQIGRTADLVDAKHRPKEPTQGCVGTILVHQGERGFGSHPANPC